MWNEEGQRIANLFSYINVTQNLVGLSRGMGIHIVATTWPFTQHESALDTQRIAEKIAVLIGRSL